MEFATLSNGVRMPKVGFGVYRVPAEECQPVVQKALEVGYRHLDTAQCYFNEEQVGAAIQASSVDRSDIFLTTKVWIGCYGEGQTYASVERSLRRLKTDYLDLVLLHQAFADYYGAWRDLVRLYEEGKVRAIGTSNFLPVRLADLAAFGGMAPQVNQVETNPLCQQRAAHDYRAAAGIQHQAWAPLGAGAAGVLDSPVICGIAERLGKTTAQVVLRWLLQRDIVVLAKSTHEERMRQNLDVFDFELATEDVAAIEALDTGHGTFIDPSDPATIDFFRPLVEERRGLL